jgi:hypothetical protein
MNRNRDSLQWLNENLILNDGIIVVSQVSDYSYKATNT